MNYLHFARALLRMGALVGFLLILMTFPFSVLPLVADGISFFDDLTSYDTGHWNKADGWCNPSWFDTCWKADHISHDHSIMTIKLDDAPCPSGCSDRPYTSGEYRTYSATSTGDEYYGYGCFEARFKPSAGSGLITSFFTYSGGTWDTPPGGNGLHNEIDIEILGKDTTQMQVNFFANDVGKHEQMLPLGFDAASDFHNYAFKWTAAGIEWYVDGSTVYSVTDTTTPNAMPANGGPHKIMMNFWPVDPNNADLVKWAGPFTYTEPLYAEYDWIRYTAGSDCQPAGAGPSAPPSNLSAISALNATVDLSWTDNSTNESGFKVERSLDGISWMEIATVTANQPISDTLITISYSDNNLAYVTTYYYRVRAYNAYGHSTYSNIDSATTGSCMIYLPLVFKHWPPVPDTPTLNPIPNSDGDGNYSVSWTSAALAESYSLQVATDVNFSSANIAYQGSTTSHTVNNQPAGTYYYRVSASNGWGDSSWSNVESVSVEPPPPPIVIDDFESISDWSNPYGDLNQFGRCSDAVEGTYSFCIGGWHEYYTWVGETDKNLSPIQNWSDYNLLKVWIRRVDASSRNGKPYLSFVISDSSGGKAYLHRDGDTCLRWYGGGWRTPIESYNWALYMLPLRQNAPDDCYYTTNINWDKVNNVNIELRTGLDYVSPSDVYMDYMVVDIVP